jgi:hypothetical protein
MVNGYCNVRTSWKVCLTWKWCSRDLNHLKDEREVTLSVQKTNPGDVTQRKRLDLGQMIIIFVPAANTPQLPGQVKSKATITLRQT